MDFSWFSIDILLISIDFIDFYWFYWFPPGSGTRGLGVLPMCEPMSQSEESGEPRHSKLPFGWGELKSERNSKTSGISDFESLHPAKKNFDGRGSAGNRFFGVVRFGGFRPGREISSPAGRSRARPARSRSRFSRSWKDFRDFQEIMKNFSGF